MGLFPVNVKVDGGSDGNNAQQTNATWTYTVCSLEGKEMGAKIAPLWARLAGTIKPGHHGYAYFGQDGKVQLSKTDEVWTAPKLDEQGRRMLDEAGRLILKQE